jgi:hypothetical protein
MRVKEWIILGFVGLLAGCASSSSKLDRELRSYVGQKITALSAVFGDPESVLETVSETQYTWTVENRFVITRRKLSMNTDDLSRMPVLPATLGSENVHLHYQCNLRVVTDQGGIIKNFHAKGNEGCERLVTELEMAVARM